MFLLIGEREEAGRGPGALWLVAPCVCALMQDCTHRLFLCCMTLCPAVPPGQGDKLLIFSNTFKPTKQLLLFVLLNDDVCADTG